MEVIWAFGFVVIHYSAARALMDVCGMGLCIYPCLTSSFWFWSTNMAHFHSLTLLPWEADGMMPNCECSLV